MIYNIRGTHGSGKSTIVKSLLANGLVAETILNGKRIEAYKLVNRFQVLTKDIYVIGPYETACGGCDAVQPYSDIWPLVLKYAKKGHVVFEGALISSCVGAIGEAMAKRKDCMVCYLDTPLQLCLDRITERRTAKGNNTPLNPKNTTNKYESVARTRAKFEAMGVRCVTLQHKKATKRFAAKQFLEVLLENCSS